MNALPDSEIIRRARRSKVFASLWEGDISGYATASKAEVALCGRLAFWCGPDADRVERLFGQSKLAEGPNWSSRAYRAWILQTAIKHQRKFHSGIDLGDVSQGTQEYTDLSGIDRSVICHTREKSEETASQSGQGVGIEIAIKLAKTRGKEPAWVASFELARKLRAISKDDYAVFRPAVEAFCKAADRPFSEFWYVFIDRWYAVRVDEGEDAFSVAVKMAEASPYSPTPCPGPEYATIASIARHLGRLRGSEPFFLPIRRLAEVINFSEMTISRILKLLARHGVIEVVDPSFSYKDKKAKTYKFIGPELIT